MKKLLVSRSCQALGKWHVTQSWRHTHTHTHPPESGSKTLFSSAIYWQSLMLCLLAKEKYLREPSLSLLSSSWHHFLQSLPWKFWASPHLYHHFLPFTDFLLPSSSHSSSPPHCCQRHFSLSKKILLLMDCLQCCVSFRCTAKWFSYAYICIHSFLI